MVYLDWAATTPPDRDIIKASNETAFLHYGNPSSVHPLGRASSAVLEEARARCAAVLSCDAGQLTFTSGGSESNAMIFLAQLLRRERGSFLVSALEHPSVLEPALMLADRGAKMTTFRPDSDGILSPAKLGTILESLSSPQLVALMGVNNETGVIQDIGGLAAVLRAAQKNPHRPIHFHVDLVQAFGKIPIKLSELDIDSASFSAHKFRGPRGIGLLYHRNPRFDVLVRGGGQEKGKRPGTENLAGVLGLAHALERYRVPSSRVADNGVYLLEQLRGIAGGHIIPEGRKESPERYVPGIIAVSFPPLPAEVLARVLAQKGYAVSQGSACHNNRKRKSRKNSLGMGLIETLANSMIRISIGPATKRKELEDFMAVLKEQISILSKDISC